VEHVFGESCAARPPREKDGNSGPCAARAAGPATIIAPSVAAQKRTGKKIKPEAIISFTGKHQLIFMTDVNSSSMTKSAAIVQFAVRLVRIGGPCLSNTLASA
jgi:hypothetical protein